MTAGLRRGQGTEESRAHGVTMKPRSHVGSAAGRPDLAGGEEPGQWRVTQAAGEVPCVLVRSLEELPSTAGAGREEDRERRLAHLFAIKEQIKVLDRGQAVAKKELHRATHLCRVADDEGVLLRVRAQDAAQEESPRPKRS